LDGCGQWASRRPEIVAAWAERTLANLAGEILRMMQSIECAADSTDLHRYWNSQLRRLGSVARSAGTNSGTERVNDIETGGARV
jgi:hypothetical protein